VLVWTCTENGRKYNSQKIIVYEFGIKINQEIDGKVKNIWWKRVAGI
jgi:hypothetical protein